jgi:dTDP-4-dehydrorhamnose reductase
VPEPTILQFGVTGQVGRELIEHASARGVGVIALAREQADLRKPDEIIRAITGAAESIKTVVNAAAYTAVDAAEQNEAEAFAINADAPAAMARACAQRGARLIHLSTDYVFDGTASRPYREDDPVCPLGAYGRSKLAGEEAVLQLAPDSIILRTAWVFSSHGKNFVKTMLRFAAERQFLGIVDDQVGCPTPAGAIANAVLDLVQHWERLGGPGGVYHFAGDTPVTWRQFADRIFLEWSQHGRAVPVVKAIATKDFPTPATRPANSVLDCGRLLHDYGIHAADWQGDLVQVIERISELENRRA